VASTNDKPARPLNEPSPEYWQRGLPAGEWQSLTDRVVGAPTRNTPNTKRLPHLGERPFGWDTFKRHPKTPSQMEKIAGGGSRISAPDLRRFHRGLRGLAHVAPLTDQRPSQGRLSSVELFSTQLPRTKTGTASWSATSYQAARHRAGVVVLSSVSTPANDDRIEPSAG
jgi:hypothetical protein